MNYNVNEQGYYGEFGGAYIPEMLYPNVEELRQHYLKIMAEKSFQKRTPTIAKRLCGTANAALFCEAIFRKIQYQNLFKTRRSLPHGRT